MTKLFSLKNWEIFLILFVLPFLININITFLVPNIVLILILFLSWIGVISFWLKAIADRFKSEYINQNELRIYFLNLICFNAITIFAGIIILFSYYGILKGASQIIEHLSKIDDYVSLYLYGAIIINFVIAGRILSAKKLQRNIKLKDYYKNSLLFIILPIGIFWIQNEINELITSNNSNRNKKRESSLILLTFALLLLSAFTLKDGEFSFQAGQLHEVEEITNTTFISNLTPQQDSILNGQDDTLIAINIFNEALELYAMGETRNAINILTISIQLDSTNPEFYYNRGVMLFESFNQLDSAIIDMTTSIQLNPSDWRSYQNRGYYYFLQKKYVKAFKDVNEVISLKPDLSTAYILRAELKKNNGDKESACKDLRVADSLGNEDAFLLIFENCNSSN